MSNFKRSMMKRSWFEGSNIINCSLHEIESTIGNLGEFFSGVVSFMPGLTSVELTEEGGDYVLIKTNEGIMKRNNIKISLKPNKVIVEFDEEYQAGRLVTPRSHFYEEFIPSEIGVNHRIVISDVSAPGLLGFFYKAFGSSNIGKAVLKSYKTYFEMSRD